MQLHVTAELGARLAHSAAQEGRNPDELAQEVLTRYFEEESRLVEAVKRGEEALDRGDYLTHEQVTERLRRFLWV
jgi:predicted transcriptional regulator